MKSFSIRPRIIYKVVDFDFLNDLANVVNLLFLGCEFSNDDCCELYALFQTYTLAPDYYCVRIS